MSRAVVFDLDGTLADTPAAIADLITSVLTDLGRPPSPDSVLATVGKPLEASLAALLGTTADDPLTATAAKRYRARFGDAVLSRGPALLFPGVADGLDRLREGGWRLAVATSKISRSAHDLLAATGIADRFEVVVGHDMVSRGKPDPEMGLRALAALDAEPARSWYVGDTVTDVRMALAAGMRALAVTYGVDGAQALAAAGAGPVAESFGAVVSALLPSDPHRPSTDVLTGAPL